MTTMSVQSNGTHGSDAPSESTTSKLVHRTMLGLVWAVAAFWTWFVIASHWNEGPALLAEGLTIVIPIVALAWLAWRKPLWAGALFVAFGAVTAWLFHNGAVYLYMSGPLLLAGAYFVWRGTRRARAVA